MVFINTNVVQGSRKFIDLGCSQCTVSGHYGEGVLPLIVVDQETLLISHTNNDPVMRMYYVSEGE